MARRFCQPLQEHNPACTGRFGDCRGFPHYGITGRFRDSPYHEESSSTRS